MQEENENISSGENLLCNANPLNDKSAALLLAFSPNNEIDKDNEDETVKKYEPIFIPIDPHLDKLINCEYLRSEIRNYPWKQTRFGDVFYSPRYSDDRYTYRHVILSRGVRREAERLAEMSPNGLLVEEQFIHELGVDLSSGWEHFMRFKGKLKELILRRPLNEQENHDGAPTINDEVEIESDDSEIKNENIKTDENRCIE